MKKQAAPPATTSDAFLGVWTWNAKTGIVVACSDVCRYLNIPTEVGIHGVPAERFYEAIHPDDMRGLIQAVEKALHGDDPFLAEYRIVSVEHGTVRVRSNGRCFRDSAGRPTHISGYLSRIDLAPVAAPDDEAVLNDVIEHLSAAFEAAAGLSKPVLSKLISAVLLEAGTQLAAFLRRH
ncbi:PAS domain-containing protein [Aureimonas phyllosphaerae]|uniref:PAS domain-containing protein n=1 Tax=Aureimonas phyllosphaerae TaxID=1166078 RepID=UPI003A5BA0EA